MNGYWLITYEHCGGRGSYQIHNEPTKEEATERFRRYWELSGHQDRCPEIKSMTWRLETRYRSRATS